MFRVALGIGRAELESMSVPEMVDHLEYWRGVSDGREA